MSSPIKKKRKNDDISATTEESPKKVSFSFNFDLESGVSDDSSDSETPNLQIDVAEVDDNEPPKKRMRIEIDETCALNEMEEEIERQLDAKAAKTNLTATNVKNILKHVITNEHVLAMVQNSLYNTEDGTVFEPKLTRAKIKELAMSQPNMPWPMTPIKKTASSEVQVLIEKDLSEDSSDEEYSPEQDKESDDDAEVELSTTSDVDSQPSTPVNPDDAPSTPEKEIPVDIHYDSEGIFKIPGIPHVPTEEESIGQRTRSKLSLSETPLEQIEQAFIPPDITTDMYDWDCDIDEDWDNFLKEFTRPLGQDATVEDDPEADPEYNILEDKETDLLDKEELRMDKAVKVTRKELNNLVAELFEFEDMFVKDDTEQPKKRKMPENSTNSVMNNAMNNCMVDLLPALSEPELPQLVSPEQFHLLATQLRQHVQLMTQHFAMTYMHPQLDSYAKVCKDNLSSLSYLKDGSDSAFNVENLADALKFVSDWENLLEDENFRSDYHDFVAEEVRIEVAMGKKSRKYIPKFHPKLAKLMVESKALMYPQLLPHTPFRISLINSKRGQYLNSEEFLIALGLEQFVPFVEGRKSRFKNKKMLLMDTAQLIQQYILPCRPAPAMVKHIQASKNSDKPNAIKTYYMTGAAPRTIHCITLDFKLIAPKDQEPSLLPQIWQDYLKDRQKMIRLQKKHRELLKPSADMLVDESFRNPVVNMLPSVSFTRISPKAVDPFAEEATTESVSEDLSPARLQQLRKTTGVSFTRISPKAIDPLAEEATTESGSDETSPTARLTQSRKTTELSSPEKIQKDVDPLADETIESVVEESSPTARSPQLRQTTPRLAKIRSAQNMKLMTQVSGSKIPSNCSRVKARAKSESSKDSEESCGSTKGDNEDEIAELMLASTTIKKDTANRKKAKQARELENIKRLLEAESELAKDERATKYAASYLQKLHTTLESSNPEALKTVIKLHLEYNEKLERINEAEAKEASSENRSEESSAQAKERNDKTREAKDFLAINLYKDICNHLRDYPELCTDFLLFLKPHQAAMIDESTEHTMVQKMNEFMNVALIYFAKQPSRLARVMKAITQLASNRYVTLEDVHATMDPILRGHPLVMDMFLQILPTEKPPESLFAMNLFENLTCPMGPYDKHKVYTEDSAELYENVELPMPTSQEDPYGGDNCKCDCHDSTDSNLKTVTEHCVSCGTRFLNGRIYLQTLEGLRPAKITFPGDDEEKLENIARVSLKTTERFIPVTPTTRRRKSSKNESTSDEQSQKPSSTKNSPTKDSDDGDKSTTKSRRGARSPPKISDQRKLLKANETLASAGTSAASTIGEPTSPLKSKRETRAERREAKLESKNTGTSSVGSKLNGGMSPGISGEQSDESATRTNRLNFDSSDSEANVNCEKMETAIIKTEIDIDVDDDDSMNYRPWARHEDMILLQNIKKDYSETTFTTVSEMLGDRTVEQVRNRCQTLLSLLEKML